MMISDKDAERFGEIDLNTITTGKPTKGKTMNEVAPNNTPATVDLHTEVDDLPDFLKQAIKDGKPVEIQTDEEVVGEGKPTLN